MDIASPCNEGISMDGGKKNSRNTTKCTISYYMRNIFYIAPTCFGAITSSYSGSCHQHFIFVQLFKKFWCQLPEDGEIIAPKHVGAM